MRVIFGHQDFAQTACPGTQVMARIELITFAKREEPDMPNEATITAATIIRELAAFVEHGLPVPDSLKRRLAYIGVRVG